MGSKNTGVWDSFESLLFAVHQEENGLSIDRENGCPSNEKFEVPSKAF